MDRSDREKWLKAFLVSDEWTQLLLPVLRSRVVEQEQRAMRAQTLDEVRLAQGAWRVLEWMVRDAAGFCAEASD
jgi:hypothetical protein